MVKREFKDLIDLMEQLRDPENGCPWDREQTPDSLTPYVIEEAYEVVEAIENRDYYEWRSELGDLLFQVVFHAQIAKEESRFDIYDVIGAIHSKMVRRHPHVFGTEEVSGVEDVLRNWETIKAAERKLAAEEAGRVEPPALHPSILDGVSMKVPAMLECSQLSARAARVGFDWPNFNEVIAKLREEIDELVEAAERPVPDQAELEAELGDLLFAAINVARLLKVEPESALRHANRKFRRRFRHIEESLNRAGKTPDESNLAEMENLWQEAKQHD